MKPRHLFAGAAALSFFVAGLTVATIYAERMETRYIRVLAPQMFAQKNLGVALQRTAFRQPDLLPLYGSSDLNVRNRYHASALFRAYPTGFTIFPVGNVGSTSLIWLQAIAAIGGDLRGKKLVVTVPASAFASDAIDRHAYAASFSALQANALVFSAHVSFPVKQAAARRMLQFPETLTDEPLLRFALERLAAGSLSDRALYYASWPAGTLHTLVLRLQDHWETLAFLRAQLGLSPVRRQDTNLDWTALLGDAEREARLEANGNRFGFENTFWAEHAPEIAGQKGMYASVPAFQDPQRSAEWFDVDLLLRVVKDLGGEPLILSRPMNGAYFDYLGIGQSTRRVFYERLRDLGKVHGVAVADFADHDTDRYFTVDPTAHLSAAGWVHYDRTLDAFFHDHMAGNS